jgi:hypothetical protein
VQDGESDILLEDDAAMVSETLNLYIDRWVIWQKFGVRPLAYSRVVVPESRNLELDLKIDDLLLKAGARMGERERLEYYGRVLIGKDDLPLHNPVTITERIQDQLRNEPVPAENLPNEWRPNSGA